jgi:hypothetical protein
MITSAEYMVMQENMQDMGSVIHTCIMRTGVSSTLCNVDLRNRFGAEAVRTVVRGVVKALAEMYRNMGKVREAADAEATYRRMGGVT